MAEAVSWCLSLVRVNRVRPAIQDGRQVFLKRRRAVGSLLIWWANHLFTAARSGMYLFPRVDDWLRWETDCFSLLYPDQPPVRVEADRSLVIPALSGVSLRTLLQRNDTTIETAFVLAARELRRVHGLTFDQYGGTWSHGDLHLDNMLCDVENQCAYVIDFDIRHRFELAYAHRRADDVASVLLELLGHPDERADALAVRFLTEYGEGAEPGDFAELSRLLVVPRGVARLLFLIKTAGAPITRVRPRLQTLQGLIQRMKVGNG